MNERDKQYLKQKIFTSCCAQEKLISETGCNQRINKLIVSLNENKLKLI